MWKKEMSVEEAAQLIERFLNSQYEGYPGEWSDFVDSPQRDKIVERYRKRCYELDPLVNRPGVQDQTANDELKTIVDALGSGPR